MIRRGTNPLVGFGVAAMLLALSPIAGAAQGRGNAGARTGDVVALSVELRGQIGDFYEARPASGAEALPPGIRRRLERGKPLPPGIAKKGAPPALMSRIDVPSGFEIVEVGVDVLLVEIATNVVHDVLMDIIRQ